MFECPQTYIPKIVPQGTSCRSALPDGALSGTPSSGAPSGGISSGGAPPGGAPSGSAKLEKKMKV